MNNNATWYAQFSAEEKANTVWLGCQKNRCSHAGTTEKSIQIISFLAGNTIFVDTFIPTYSNRLILPVLDYLLFEGSDPSKFGRHSAQISKFRTRISANRTSY